MRLSARTRANRRNARRSTGPKTAAGKAIVARNALRHGLAIPVALDVALAPEIERLAQAIAGEGADAIRLDYAHAIAEAQVDLMRIRQARLALLGDADARVEKIPSAVMKRLIGAVERVRRMEAGRRSPRSEEEVTRDCDAALQNKAIELDAVRYFRSTPPSLVEGFGVLAPTLARLDRYERRALSRRKRAIRELDMLQG